MKLSVIIVNYNVQYFLEQALLAVRKAMMGIEGEVFVVDNNSVDGSVAMVRKKFPEVHLISNQHNPGFSIANNQAIRQSRGEYVLLLNPDTVVEEATFQRCIDFMDAHPPVGGLGVRMIDGAGNFLPESKRGFPSPWVAFTKTAGLNRLFPHSPRFNQYHLGYLPEMETNQVDVLAGAFMWLRRTVLDEVGLLDETFFMYGEDIDLSYRIVKAGYTNYYFPETTIIHYKGESTKKGSLNYVKAFYQAMIIFARKHFAGRQASLFVFMLQTAIYLRAALTVVSNTFKRISLPLLEGLLIYGGLLLLKDFWAVYHFQNPDYYGPEVAYIYFPFYVFFWLGSIFFAGGYDEPFQLRRLLRGLLTGTLLLTAAYGLLDAVYRPSRALLLLGAAWAFAVTILIRSCWYYWRTGSWNVGNDANRRLILVGSTNETTRALQLLQKAEVQMQVLGRVSTDSDEATDTETLGRLDQIADIIHIYQVEEVVFCGQDVPTQTITRIMTEIGPQLRYKILPPDSSSIIGSHSKNTIGELYTVDLSFRIAERLHRRNKRLVDIVVAILTLVLYPLLVLLVQHKMGLLPNIFAVLTKQKTWVGYTQTEGSKPRELPMLPKAVLTPIDSLDRPIEDANTIHRLNLLYAKDYRWENDLSIIRRAWRLLGR